MRHQPNILINKHSKSHVKYAGRETLNNYSHNKNQNFVTVALQNDGSFD